MHTFVLLVLFGAAIAAPELHVDNGSSEEIIVIPAPESAHISQRIVSGSPTTVEQYPYMSNMQVRWFGNYFYQACGGSLITTTAVLSAAHCYEGQRASEWRVRLGSSMASSGGTVFTVSSLINHQNYNNKTLDNDIAIIRLATRATLSSSIALASIAGPNYNVADGATVTAIGWGTLQSGGSSPEQLQHVNVEVINQSTCRSRYAILPRWPSITENMLCAGILGVNGYDACQGDSGGPLAHNGNVIVGVTSWGYGCGDSYFPGVNARVSQYTQWIQDNTQ